MSGYREVLHRMKGGRTGSRLLVIFTVIALVGLAFVPAALAVHDLEFQLDGDVSASTTTHVGTSTQLLDWDSVFTAAGANKSPLPGGFTAAKFTKDFSTTAGGGFATCDRSA